LEERTKTRLTTMIMATSSALAPVDAYGLLSPFLPALPPAAVSTEPATGLLPLLSPVLRQRVRVFSASSSDPWLRWLCYDAAKAARLTEAVQGGALEPHPVSGEVEVDWDYDVETRYRRADEETLQALVALTELGICFQLVHCIDDPEGGADGWRVGEVSVVERPGPFATFGGASTLDEAERQHREAKQQKLQPRSNGLSVNVTAAAQNDDEDDDAYWSRYDATPARTPAQKASPAPAVGGNTSSNGRGNQVGTRSAAADEEEEDEDDDYFAQYDNVQPAMDNHDPDEEMLVDQAPPPPLGLGAMMTSSAQNGPNNHSPSQSSLFARLNNLNDTTTTNNNNQDDHRAAALLHPRPESSASSGAGSDAVARLEATADRHEKNEFGVKQHVSRSIRSLFLLSKASGIDRDEFEEMVKTELDVLAIMEDQEL
jgi:hypothetical protein